MLDFLPKLIPLHQEAVVWAALQVSLFSENSIRWLIADQGVMMNGAIDAVSLLTGKATLTRLYLQMSEMGLSALLHAQAHPPRLEAPGTICLLSVARRECMTCSKIPLSGVRAACHQIKRKIIKKLIGLLLVLQAQDSHFWSAGERGKQPS